MMLLSCFLSIAALQDPVVHISTGYYTVSDLVAELKRQEIPAKIVGSCGGDVYALRFDKRPWSQVRTALTSDGRLVIGKKNGVWQIEHNLNNKGAEAGYLKRYVDFARGAIQSVYGPVDSIIRRAEALPPEEKDKVYGSMPSYDKKDPVQNAINNLVYRVGASHDMSFLTVSGPASLTDPKNPAPFGQFRTSTLWDSTNMLLPTGALKDLRLPWVDFQKLDDAERERNARLIQIGAKLVIDPLTLTIGARSAIHIPPGRGQMFMSFGGPAIIAPYWVAIQPKPEDVWDNKARLGQKERALWTMSFNAKGPLATEVQMPVRPIRISEALLRAAEKAGVDMVEYVGAFTDTLLVPQPKRTIDQVIDDANAARLDQAWLHKSIRERISPDQHVGNQLPLAPAVKFSVTQENGVLVVRDEMRFLDGLNVSANGPGTAIDNLRLADRRPTLEQVAAHVAGLNVAAWPTCVFSSNYLHTCNPVSFYPFACVLTRSEAMRKAIAAGKNFDILLSALEPAAKAALTKGLLDARLHNDAIQGSQVGPISAAGLLDDKSRINVMISEGGYQFQLFTGGGMGLWMSWVQL